MTMKVSLITLAAVLVLSSPFAMAQSGSHYSHAAANPSMRSAMNSIPASRSQHRYVARDAETNRLNGHGISRLGITTNSGRMYNGG
jgi:hypothetical protein